ncbi:MAG: hypothetical protein PHD21_03680 [Flavobacteriales bacterium]|nr:hypothetical protein [Flavobacteriales bacterium]
MKKVLAILIAVDLCFYIAGVVMYFLNNEHYGVTVGLGMLFLTFILAPYFVVYEFLRRKKKK